MARKRTAVDEGFLFYDQLWHFYDQNRGQFFSHYKQLTKKFLAYNDRSKNPSAYLRPPQFQALELYVFLKEVFHNPQVADLFDDWRNKRDKFSEASYYNSAKPSRMANLFAEPNETLLSEMFTEIKKHQGNYPNYIYALTMGLGKTVLMATCIYYDFLMANKYPKVKDYCHNALVFAPDKTVLSSLHEIVSMDKSLVVPPEYVNILESNIKFHYLMDTSGTSLNTIDGTSFNVVISNNQKIIVKKKHVEKTSAEKLFSDDALASLYGDSDDDVTDDDSLMANQRFHKLCRMPQLGVFVDEAHHLYGDALEKAIYEKDKASSLRLTIDMLAEKTNIVACCNYTGTPYVKNNVLPEVVYSYGLADSISNGYLKEIDPTGDENVKDVDFIRNSVREFWSLYGGRTFENLNPKMAIFAADINEADTVVRPAVEEALAELGLPLSKVLVNTGDKKVTSDEDLHNFDNLDNPGSVGNEKQFIILVNKGKEGWNCRSLFSVCMYREPKSKVFVLQAAMRCLRQLTERQLTARVFLSKDNLDILNSELKNNYNVTVEQLKKKNDKTKQTYQVRFVPPERIIKMRKVWHEYSLEEKECKNTIDFKLSKVDLEKYQAIRYQGSGLRVNMTMKKTVIDEHQSQKRFSQFMLVGEIARYMHISCIRINNLLMESVDGIDKILEYVNRYNEILYDVIIPTIFRALYEVKRTKKSKDVQVVLLKEPKDKGYYEFTADPNLVVTRQDNRFTPDEIAKSFHADTYCFDSNPEHEFFNQCMLSPNVDKVYFTGMFTAGQGDFMVSYFDPYSQRMRAYYPDFLVQLHDGTYRIVEVKGDNKADDELVKAKAEAAEEMAAASGHDFEYVMLLGGKIMTENVISNVIGDKTVEQSSLI